MNEQRFVDIFVVHLISQFTLGNYFISDNVFMFTFNVYSNSLVHDGGVSHIPVARHVIMADPDRVNPLSQV